jgi:hypothetical protein
VHATSASREPGVHSLPVPAVAGSTWRRAPSASCNLPAVLLRRSSSPPRAFSAPRRAEVDGGLSRGRRRQAPGGLRRQRLRGRRCRRGGAAPRRRRAVPQPQRRASRGPG